MSESWEKVGEIGVDSGTCWVGDPCYCVVPDAHEHPAKSWSEFCDASRQDREGVHQWNYKLGHPGLGVSVTTGGGDGRYPVFVSRDELGQVAAVKVVFIETEAAEVLFNEEENE